MVKSVAERRGWERCNYAALFNVISRLVAETGDGDIRRLFRVANALRINFYENRDSTSNVAGDLVKPLAPVSVRG